MKSILKKFPPIQWLLDLRRELALIRCQVTRQTRIQQQIFREMIYKKNMETGKPFPSSFEHQTYSQNGEDGILMEILRELGKGTERFVEIGSGDGLENNTRLLLDLGWKGLWIDGDENNCSLSRLENTSYVESGALCVENALVTVDNVNELLNKTSFPEALEVLSLDVDLNTYHIWEAIEKMDARIVILEYNGFFPPDCEWIAENDPDGWWEGGIKMGASLASMTRLSKKKGYRLVACDLSGTNAFFVKEELASVHFPESGDPSRHYEPARPFLLNNPEHRTDLQETT